MPTYEPRLHEPIPTFDAAGAVTGQVRRWDALGLPAPDPIKAARRKLTRPLLKVLNRAHRTTTR